MFGVVAFGCVLRGVGVHAAFGDGTRALPYPARLWVACGWPVGGLWVARGGPVVGLWPRVFACHCQLPESLVPGDCTPAEIPISGTSVHHTSNGFGWSST